MIKEQINKLAEAGLKFYTDRNSIEAINILKQAIVLASDNNILDTLGDLYLMYGKALSLKGYYSSDYQAFDEALIAFTEARRLIDYSVNLCLEIGKIYLFKKEFGQAFEYFSSALNKSNTSLIKADKISALVGLSRYYLESQDLENSKSYDKLAADLLTAETSESSRIEYLQNKISLGVRQHDFEGVARDANKVLELTEGKNDIENEIKALNAKGITAAVKGDYREAFKNLWLANEKSIRINHKSLTAWTLINIGNIFSSLYNYDKALKQHLKVINEYIDQIDEYTFTVLCHNIGGTYVQLGNEEQAIAYYEKGLEVTQKKGIHKIHAILLYEISKVYTDRDIDKAVYYVNRTKKFLESYNISSGIEINSINLAEIYFKQGKYEKALEKALQSLLLCEKAKNNKTLTRVYFLLSNVYKEFGEFEKALRFHELFHGLRTEFLQEMRQRRTLDLEITYEIKEKEQQINLLKLGMELQQMELAHTTKIKEQSEMIHQANEEIKQFTYAVSHDLKEPLRMIGSFTNLINRKVKKLNDNSIDEYAGYVVEGVGRMEGMLTGMLDYARLGKYTDLDEVVDLSELIQGILLNLRIRVQESNAEVIFEILPIVQTNKILISQLFQNLIANAIKFSRKGVVPIINIKVKEDKGHFVFSVEDNGIGIREDLYDKVFGLFSRLHTREEFEGTGIGLAMSKKIMKIIQGKIWIESKVGVGTTFYFSVPNVAKLLP